MFRISRIFRRRQRERDLQDELAAHLAMDAQQRIESGESPDAARTAARRDLGNVTRIAEDTRAAWTWQSLEQFAQDIRHAGRSAARNPGFTLVAVLTLALAVGATTAIFSFVYLALLQPLPLDQPDQLVRLFETRSSPISPGHFQDWKEQNRVFDRIAAFQAAPGSIQTGVGVEQVGGMAVSADFFTLLGIQPLYGRDFLPEEETVGSERVAIISHEFWRSRLGGDPNAIGKRLQFSPENIIVIGVLPAGFRFTPEEIGLWTPLRLGDDSRRRDERFLRAVARLRDGVTLSQADAEMDALAKRLAADNGQPTESVGVDVVPLQELLVGNLRTPFFVLLGASTFVLLIGCSNLANLFFARALARDREITIRVALGAGRFRILRLLITESSLIGLAGGITGTLVAIWAIEAALPFLAQIGGPYAFVVSRMLDAGVDRQVLFFGMTLAMLAVIFCAIVSAMHATRSDLHDALQHGGRSAIGSRSHARVRSALVVAEISLTFILLVGAGLLLNSFWRMRQVDLGFNRENLLTMRLYSSPPEAIDFYENVIQRIRAATDVKSASVVSSLPLLGVDLMTNFIVENRPPVAAVQGPQAATKVVGKRYFETMGIPLLQGRYFNEQDGEGREPVVIVNEAAAREFWPGENPVGRRIQRGGPNNRPWNTIVGVVRDVKVRGPDRETPPEIYFPHAQFILAPNSRMAIPNMTLVVRTAAPIAPLLRGQIQALKKDALITNIEFMDDALATVVAPRELNTALVSIFAFVALSLAIVGIYGVMSYSVTRRSQEIAVRVALGAQRREVLLLVLRQGFRLVSLGVLIGLAGAVALTRWISTLLFEVEPTDPLTLSAMAVLLVAVSLLACYLPARRAGKLDPLSALREE